MRETRGIGIRRDTVAYVSKDELGPKEKIEDIEDGGDIKDVVYHVPS